MNIGLVDVDSHNYPNFALMRIAGYYKNNGHNVEWANPLIGGYDKVFKSKIFTFSPDDLTPYDCVVEKGGTGYDIKKRLPEEIESSTIMDYSLYPQYEFSIQFFSRGCIRHCPFCLVREKEGKIHPVTPVNLNPNGKWIEVFDNNFFANPEWKEAINYLLDKKQKVHFHGVDVRIMDEEQAYYLNQLKHKGKIHIAWDLPQIDLTDRLKAMTTYIKPYKICCYVLVGFNSTKEQDLHRLRTLKEIGIQTFVQPYRDFENERKPTQYEKDLANWANQDVLFKSFDFMDFSPRKGFRCSEYFKD